MRKLYTLTLLWLIFLSFNAIGQQIAPFNQYTEYQYLNNPSYVGRDSASSVLMLYRNQWSGLVGAPQNGLIYINSKLNDQAGIGGYLVQESANILGSTAGYLTFSFSLDIAEGHRVGFGLGAGVIQKRILFERIKAQQLGDPALLDAGQSQSSFDGSFGLNYRYKNLLELSFASQQLFGGSVTFIDQSLELQSEFALLRHYYLTGIFYLPKNNMPVDLSFIATLRTVQSLQGQWDLGVRASWRDMVNATLLYRDDYGLSTMFGVKVLNSLQFQYAYEIPSNGIGLAQSQGSHEISLRLLFSGK